MRDRLPSAERSGRSRISRLTAAFLVVVICAGIGGIPVYVRPQIDPLRHADAILILGGAGYARYPFGISLAQQDWAPNLLVSNPLGPRDPWLQELCEAPHPDIDMHCFVPDPPTTKGEGRELRRLAAENGWRTVIVVTFRPHVSRARFILEQCFDGQLIIVESPATLSLKRWVAEYVYQTAGYARAVLQPGC